MSEPIRVVHYLNQFFAGIGGEDKADAPVGYRQGPVGLGLALGDALGAEAGVVATVWCGDDRFHRDPGAAMSELLRLIEAERPDVLILGPAFNAGRYGTACAMLGSLTSRQLGIPVVSGMFPENPGVEVGRRDVYIAPTGEMVTGMREAVRLMARLALRLARNEPLGPAAAEGHLGRGVRRNMFDTEIAAERMVAMLVNRLTGKPFQTELPLPVFDRVPPAPPVADLTRARIALVTEAGIIPHGNPDALESWHASKWVKYRIADLDRLTPDRFTSVHGGFDTTRIREDPNRIVPLDVVREIEREGRIGRVHENLYVTMGNVMPVMRAKQFGREMAGDLRKEEVDAVLLSAT